MSSMTAILIFILVSFIVGAGLAWWASSMMVAPLKKLKPRIVVNKQ